MCIAADDNAGVIAVFHACNLDAKVARAVADQIESFTGADCRVAACIELETATVKSFATVLKKQLAPGDRLMVALHVLGTNETEHTILTIENADQPFALLNMSTLMRDDPGRTPTSKVVLRRVEKESLRAISALVGLPKCPTIFCASHRHKDIDELDAKSYNFCPPCRLKIEDLLRKHGLDVKTQIEQIRERLKSQPAP